MKLMNKQKIIIIEGDRNQGDRNLSPVTIIMRILVSMAFWLLRTEGNIDTPYSVKAKGVVVECFKVLNRSQFATSSVISSLVS
jgi:hypothetical protein